MYRIYMRRIITSFSYTALDYIGRGENAENQRGAIVKATVILFFTLGCRSLT